MTRKLLTGIGLATFLTLGPVAHAMAQTTPPTIDRNVDVDDDDDSDKTGLWGLAGLLGLAGLGGLARRRRDDNVTYTAPSTGATSTTQPPHQH